MNLKKILKFGKCFMNYLNSKYVHEYKKLLMVLKMFKISKK